MADQDAKQAEEHPGVLDRVGQLLGGGGEEGDAPRAVNMAPPPLETHNRTAIDEPYPSPGINASPRTPGAGTIDQSQGLTTSAAEAPGPPIGPDTLAGGRLGSVPTPPTPRSDKAPTAEPAGLYGGADTGGQKMGGPGEADE